MVARIATRSRHDSPTEWPDLEDAEDGRLNRWRDWLCRVWETPGFSAAVEVASPVVARRVHELRAGAELDERQVRRLVMSILRYLVRATGRATPFGLFAGVAPARLGTPHHQRLGVSHRPVVRVESEWLAEVVARLEASRELRQRLMVVLTDLAFVRDDRLVVGCQSALTRDGAPAEVSVRHTAATRAVCRAARTPIRLDELAAALSREFPTARASVIDTMLAGLVAQRVLVSSLHPPMTATDPLGHVVDVLTALHADSIPDIAALAGDLRDVHATLVRHNTAPSHARELRVRVARTAAVVDPGERVISVDLQLDAEVVVPPAVVREAESAAAVLTRLTPHPFGSSDWQDYHGRFLERYGVGALVPVQELLGDTGLGFPSGYRGARMAAVTRSSLSERDDTLLALAQRAVIRNREVVLDEEIITRLAVTNVEEIRVAPHTELRVRVQAATPDALRAGEFELALAGVSRSAGTTTGRFLDLFSDVDRARMWAAYAGLPTVNENAISAQMSCPTLYLRADNVTRTPTIVPHVLSLGEHHADHEHDGVVSLADLVVVGDPYRLYLWSLSRQAPVEPLVFSAVEFRNHAHPLARFLCEISTARAATCVPFSWGVASRLPVLPRVRYQRTILAPARWTLTSTDVPKPATPWKDWANSVADWRRHYRVPANIFLGEYDRRMWLDLSEPAHLHLLRAELDRTGTVAIREAPDDSAFGWLNGHAHELVIPLGATSEPVPHRHWTQRVVEREHGHLPAASPWLYFKLYGHPDRQNDILITHLPTLLSTWNNPPAWWFLRYHDPEPHLRFRFQVLEDSSFGPTAERIGTWVRELRRRGLVEHMQFDTYHPEIGRFGTAAMTAAEAVFVADSAAVVAQLSATTDPDGDHPHAIIAASMIDLAMSAAGNIKAGMQWLIDNATSSPAPAPARAVRASAVRLANPDDDWAALRSVPGGDRIITAWRQRHATVNAYRTGLAADNGSAEMLLPDFLHLHHVRMVGVDRDTERACIHLARAAALSWTTRTRGTR